jgi:protein-disulfide isomerase
LSAQPRESKREARERLAAERKAQAAAQRRRERIQRLALFGVVAAVVIAVVVVVIINSNRVDTSGSNPAGTDDTYGVVVGDGPVRVEVYEDFQCPACATFEQQGGGEALDELASDGDATVVYYPLSFLDANLGNDSSSRAANASGCVADQGGTDAFVEFHGAVFANQPAEEGTGFTDDQLIEFGGDAGVEGDAFTSCVEDRDFSGWVSRVAGQGREANVVQTPTILVAGEELARNAYNPEGLRAAVEAAS